MKRKLDLFEYNDNDGVGRLRTITPSQEIAIAEKLEANMMTKAQFNALAEERKANRAGGGFEEWGKHYSNTSSHPNVNEGIWTVLDTSNTFCMGRDTGSIGISKTKYPVGIVNGTVLKIEKVNVINNSQNNILLPTAPNIYPHDTVLTPEQISSGVIKHADASNSGLIVNGKFDTDTSGWTILGPGTVAVIDNQLVCTASGVDSGVQQAFATIVGKSYIAELNVTTTKAYIGVSSASNGTFLNTSVFVTSSGKVQFNFVAASATSYLIFKDAGSTAGSSTFDNIAVYPADAISRSDFVFLESWHEDISEKNFVYPLGNVQYLGGNTDGLTGIGNGSFTGFETYSLFGNWQTPSALIGKGYVWSSLTEAQKRAFVANPENNCYLDGDKVIQVRYRVRVVQGLGDSWTKVSPESIDSTNAGYSTLNYTDGVTKYVQLKGKTVSLPSDISGTLQNGFFVTKAKASFYDGVDNGLWIGAKGTNTILDNTSAYEGKCFALPIALVHRKNSGLYHNTYNPNGSKKASDDNFWYNTAVSFTSISDCFDQAKLLTASGYIGTVSGRPDRLFYDQVHEGDITDLRNSSKKIEDYNRLINREFNKLVAGTNRGKEGEYITYTKYNTVLTYGAYSEFNTSLEYVLNTSNLPAEIQASLVTGVLNQDMWFTLVVKTGVDAGKILSTRNILKYNAIYTMLTPKGIRYTDGSVVQTLTGQTVDIYVSYKSTRTKSNILLHCDIIGNPTNYPTAWKESGVFGTPLIVAEDGTSLLPDGVLDTFKLSRKANATPLLCLRSTDNGVTWTSFTPTFNTTTNAITLTDEPATNLVMVYYQTHTSMAYPVVNSEVLEIEGTANMLHNYAPESGACLVDTLIGKTPIIGGFASMKQSISSFGIYPTNNRLYSSTPPAHNQILPINGIVPAVKVFPYLTRTNGKAYLNLVFKEMKHNGTSWGDDNKFNIVDNVSTTTDNNAQTVLIGQKTVELPYFIGADE